MRRDQPHCRWVEEVGLQIPLIVRLEGTNVDAGKDMLGTQFEHFSC